MNTYQTHQGAVPVGTARSFPEPYQGNQRPPVPRAVSPQGTYSGYSSNYNATPASGTAPYNSYVAGYGATSNPYPSPAVQPSPAVASFTGNAPGCYGGRGYSSRANPQAPRAPAFLPSPSPPANGGSTTITYHYVCCVC